MRITAIEPQQKKRLRYNIFVDGKFALDVSQIVLQDYDLYVAKEITSEQLKVITDAEKKRKAINYAYLLLSYRSRSLREIEQRMQEKGYSAEIIGGTIQYLTEQGYLNDHEFAKQWIHNRLQNKPMGKWALQQELNRKGVDKAIIDACLAETITPADEEAAAWQLVSAKFGSKVNGWDCDTLWRRAGGFLQRRGYSYAVVKKVMAALLAEKR